MPPIRRPRPVRPLWKAAAAALIGAATAVATARCAPAAERQVLLTAACDSYGDLKKQLAWLGPQIDNPALAGMLESVLLLATQGRGLAGLDVKRPLGIVVSSDGTDLAVHGFVPIRDLDKLLTSLQGVTGPAEADGEVRRVTLPSGIPLEIKRQADWAMVAPAGMAEPPADMAAVLEALTKGFSLGVEAFPGRMPEPVREQLAAAVAQALAAAAPQQPADPAAVQAAVEALRQTESFSLGVAIDPESETVFLENRSVMMPGSAAAGSLAAAGGGAATVGVPAATDGKSPAIRGHVVQAISDSTGRRTLETIDRFLPPDGADPLTTLASRLVRELLAAMVASGGIDAAFAVDPSAASKESPLPAMTAGVRVKDGAALERKLKQALGTAGPKLPGVDVTFDTGRVGTANLHTVGIDIADLPAAEQLGRRLDLTLAVAPGYAFVLAGGNPKPRITAAVEASGRANPDSKPIAAVEVAMNRLLDSAAARNGAAEAEADGATGGSGPSQLLMSVRPVERGLVTRLSADAGALKAAAMLGKAAAPGGPGGIPLPPLQQVPGGLPIPVPAR